MKNKKILLLPIIAVLITVLSLLPQDAHAAVFIDVNNQTTCQVAPVFGVWIEANSTCRTSSDLILNSGDILTFENVTIVTSGIINNSGLIDPGAVYHPFHPSNLINYGTINNNNGGQIYWLKGILNNNRQGTINNHGSITVAHIGFVNSGIFDNYNLIDIQEGFFKNLVHGIVNNNGTFLNRFTGNTTNVSGATINNYGTINNTAFANTGNIFNNRGSITNNGFIFNQILQCFTCGPNSVVFKNSGTIVNSGSIFNEAIKCTSCATYPITFDNSGIIANTGSFNNSQLINEYCGGTITGNSVLGNPPVLNGCTLLRNTATTVSANPAATSVGTKITFHVKVVDSSSGLKILPTGLVKWDDGGVGGIFSSNSCTLIPLTSISTCAVAYTPPLATGPVIITATYSGDSTHKASSGISKLTVT